jgi:DNA-binding LacI/PurR family transcriptional regulator
VAKKTIRDIARMAGVCIGTVSRVINDKDKVHPATRQRILALIEKTGYRPNALGRGLKRRRSQNVLLEVCSIVDPYCAALSESISNHCWSLGYKMLLADSKLSPALEAEHLSRVRDGSVDGMIVSPLPIRDNIPLFRNLAQTGFPIVLMDNAVPTVRMNCIKYDDVAAGKLAMDYLFEKGHERIAFVQWWPGFHTVQDRRQSYLESHKNRGVRLHSDYVVTMPDAFRDWSRQTFERLLALPAPPTAILAENEIVAVACMNIVLKCGMRIPHDVAVMAFGDTLLESLVPVPLTTVALHHQEASLTAVELLADLIENPGLRRQTLCRHVQTPSLVIRDSA